MVLSQIAYDYMKANGANLTHFTHQVQWSKSFGRKSYESTPSVPHMHNSVCVSEETMWKRSQ